MAIDSVSSLAEVKNMVALQLFTLGGSGGMLPQEILVILGCSGAHSGAF